MKTKKLTVLIALAALLYVPALHAQSGNPFTSTSTTVAFSDKAAVTHFQITEQKGRIFFDWSVSANEEADLFELEKSTDGRRFTTAALIFTTDKKNTDQYQYYEKAAGKKMYYRLRVVHKNNEASYSVILSYPEA